MQLRTDEIADGIYRISAFTPDLPPAGFTFNHFLVDAEEPLLFHAGHREFFPLLHAEVSRLLPPERLRWIAFGHVEADECGAMNEWLRACPHAEVAHGEMGCDLSLNDLADRPPRPLADGEVIDLGGKRVRQLATPHVPHNWEAQVLFEETTGTLFCGDLLAHMGKVSPLTESDIIEPALATEEVFMGSSLSAHSGATLRRLAALDPANLALMHGAAFTGDCAGVLDDLADSYDALVQQVLDRGREMTAAGAGCPTI
jgi:flavorubredoxin